MKSKTLDRVPFKQGIPSAARARFWPDFQDAWLIFGVGPKSSFVACCFPCSAQGEARASKLLPTRWWMIRWISDMSAVTRPSHSWSRATSWFTSISPFCSHCACKRPHCPMLSTSPQTLHVHVCCRIFFYVSTHKMAQIIKAVHQLCH